MFSHLARQFFAPRSPRPTTKLRLEFLEGRDQPSTLDGGPETETPPPSEPDTTTTTTAPIATPVTSAPVITAFSIDNAAFGIIITGHVDAQDPAGMMITINSGYEVLDNIVATLDSNGDFAVAVFLDAGVNMSGNAVANCTDWNGNCAQSVYDFFMIHS